MKNKFIGLIVGFMCLSGVASVVHAGDLTEAAALPEKFTVFDATLYSNKPDLAALGFKPIRLTGAGTISPEYKKNIQELPTPEMVRKFVSQLHADHIGVVVLDFEQWALSDGMIKASSAKYLSVLKLFHEADPLLKVSLYGVIPVRDYWRAVAGEGSAKYGAWKKLNDNLGDVAEAQDFITPSIYTFYPDVDGWRAYAIAQIKEARRLAPGKKIYPVLWNEYHDSNRLLKGTYLPPEYWEVELRTMQKYADGVVIWGGWGDGKPQVWDSSAPWWKVTQEIIHSQ